ncbi:MAG: MoxR family ATPase [Nitrospirota bacterium]|nr:MoxR family ATPase [Nitrospirota bacterium]
MINDSLMRLKEQLDSVVLGKPDVTKMAIVTLIAKGHLLIEDIPGVGKTTLAYALAKGTKCSFKKVQFTSDLLPSDIIGVSIYNQESREFEFKQGPIFANIVLADEINRTNPKTQSALLEAMNERKISVDKKTYNLPEPFMVIATQNPMEYHGTFPLPESQLDRFMMHLKIGYPETEAEKKALLMGSSFQYIDNLQPVITCNEILMMQKEAEKTRLDKDLLEYMHKIITMTRKDDRIRLGVSPRGGQFLVNAVKAHAYFLGKDYVTPDDIKVAAPLIFGHRLILKTKTYISDGRLLIEEIISRIPVPV